jgi:hypothetical protein
MKKKTLHLVDNDNYDEQEDSAWREVQSAFLRVKTLDEINEKALNRAGKQMRASVYQLLNAVSLYDHLRGKK